MIEIIIIISLALIHVVMIYRCMNNANRISCLEDYVKDLNRVWQKQNDKINELMRKDIFKDLD